MFWIPTSLGRELLQLTDASWPLEACGLLIGELLPAGARLRSLMPARNLVVGKRARDGFQLDPLAQLAGERLASAHSARVLGIWHSHPCGTTEPSARDRSGDGGYGWHLLIPRAVQGPSLPRVWRTRNGHWSEVSWAFCSAQEAWQDGIMTHGSGPGCPGRKSP